MIIDRRNHVIQIIYHLTPTSFRYSFILVSFSVIILPIFTSTVNTKQIAIIIGKKNEKRALNSSRLKPMHGICCCINLKIKISQTEAYIAKKFLTEFGSTLVFVILLIILISIAALIALNFRYK